MPSLRLHGTPCCSSRTCSSSCRSNASARRCPRSVVQPVFSDASNPIRVASSRGSEATALSQQFKSKSSSSSQYDYLQYLDTEARISVQISSAQSISQLHNILATGNYADSLHNSHVSAIVAAMPGTLKNQLIGQTERLSVQRMLKQLNTLASMYLHRFQPAEIVALLEGWAALRLLDPRLHSADPILASLLTDLLCESLGDLTPTQLATATWAIGTLTVPLQGPALSALLAALQHHLAHLTAEDHIRAGHGLVHIGCPLPRAWSCDWQLRTAELSPLHPAEAAALLAVAAQLPVCKLGDAPEWVESMLGSTRGGLAALPLPALVDTLSAVAKLAHPGSVAPGWINEYLAAVAAALFASPGAARPPADLPAALQFPSAPTVSSHDLAALVSSLGTLGLQPRSEWMAALLRVVGYKLPSFQADELASLVWGLAMLDCRPQEDFLQQIVAEAECRVAEFDLSQASKITWALGMMSCP